MSILSISESAILAAKTAIATTGHNIANASTEGYSRQEVVQTSVGGSLSGVGYVGQGTSVVSIKRVYDQFLADQVNSGLTSKGTLDTYYSQIQQVDNMLADSTTGLSPAMEDFFAGLQDVSADPSSTVTRQSLLSNSESLVSRFQSMSASLTEMYQSVNAQLQTSTGLVNTYATQIAALNDTIEKAAKQSDTNMPNDLMDQRDLLISKLSEEVQLSVVQQGDSYNVYIGSGQPLIVGTMVNEVVTVASPTDPTRLEVGFVNNGATLIMDGNSLGGGNLAGLVNYRSESLDYAQNSLGRIATTLATTFNEQHQLGQDLNGDLGGAFFNVAEPVVTASYYNTSSGTADAVISDASQLTVSDYRLQITGTGPTEYQIVRLSDGELFTGSPTTVDGVDFSLSGTHAVGDSFLIRPTAEGASQISVAINDTSEIAAAAPILASASNDNLGTGSISQGTVNSLDANLQQSVTITFTSATTFDVTGTGTGLPATGLTYTSGEDVSYNGWTVQITGVPQSGDEFTVESNTDGVGDSRNAILLGELQTANLLDGGSVSYQSAYSQLVNFIGNKTGELEVTSEAADSYYTQALETQQSRSGVNLDEEAANLLRYQQAYQAAAQLMQTASELFEMLLSLGG